MADTMIKARVLLLVIFVSYWLSSYRKDKGGVLREMFHHIGLEATDKEKAAIFFEEILGIPKVKSFTLSSDLAEAIFGPAKEIEVETFAGEGIIIEVFITDQKVRPLYSHVCLVVPNRPELITKCEAYGIIPNVVKKGDKELLFIRDFSGNLFEIKS
ncbi:MAG: VOC family protein [bacterium]